MRLRTPPTENIASLRLLPRLNLKAYLERWGHHQPLRLDTDLNASGGTSDVDTLFSPDYLRENLVDLGIRGADTPALRRAMQKLAQDPLHASPALLAEIARLRGRDPETFKAEYARFQARWRADRSGQPPRPPSALSTGNSDFMAALSQLRCGALVGKALGIDAVLGAMLNPTGGLVGVGNTALDFDSCALGYHGITHDAAGYLRNYARVGPGYDYLGRERGLGAPTTSELVGHREGLYFWRQTVGRDPLSSEAEQWANGAVPYRQGFEAVAEVRERSAQVGATSRDAASAAAAGAAMAAAELAKGSAKAAEHVAQGSAQAVERLAQGVRGAARIAANGQAQAVADLARGLSEARDAAAHSAAQVSHAVASGLDDVRSLAHAPAEVVTQVAQGVVTTGAHLADGAACALAEAAQGAADSAHAAVQASRQAASGLGAQLAQASRDEYAALTGSAVRAAAGSIQAALHVEGAAIMAGQLAGDTAFTIEQQLRALRRRWDDL